MAPATDAYVTAPLDSTAALMYRPLFYHERRLSSYLVYIHHPLIQLVRMLQSRPK